MFRWFKKGPVDPDEFRLAPGANMDGTSLQGEVVVSPLRMVATFGPPGEGDGDKVSGCYTFVDRAGDVITVYDWKATNLYDFGDEDMEPAPTPEAYWAGADPDTLHIGGRKGSVDVKAFRRWLLDRLG